MDESVMTGEARHVEKLPGSCVVSGTLNAGWGPLVVEVTAVARDGTVARLTRLMETAALQVGLGACVGPAFIQEWELSRGTCFQSVCTVALCSGAANLKMPLLVFYCQDGSSCVRAD